MENNIKKLFGFKGRKFEIPSYQRAYSWDEKQILQFIDDLKNTETLYYLGHYLFEMKDENTFYVIDGQQRLTTSIIFFSTLIVELNKRKEDGEQVTTDLVDIEDYYLQDIRKRTQKFVTVKDDNNFFIDEIIERKPNHSKEPDTNSKIRIRNAKEIFEKEFSSTTTENLEKWCDLIENATITEFIVKDKIQATQVFAFQNDRGKKLTNLEIIKAYFMLQIYLSNSNQDKIEADIRYLEAEISIIYQQITRINAEEDEVLNYYWRAVSGSGYYSVEVVEDVKNKVKAMLTDKTEWIKEFLSGLSQAFQTVEKVEKSTEGYTMDLKYLRNMALAYPFLIKAYKLKADEKTINRLTRLLENITFRYLLRGGRAEIESRLNFFLVGFKTIDHLNKYITEMASHIENNGYWGYWNNNSMLSYLNSGFFYKKRVDNYVLWKYEMFLCDKDHPLPHKVSFDDLIGNESIEHIAPQTETNGDAIANGYGTYNDKETPDSGIVSGEWLNCLGNLVLISRRHNSSIGNKAFSTKLESYGKENLLNQQKEIGTFVTDATNPIWDRAAIEKRHEKIKKAALEIWSLEGI